MATKSEMLNIFELLATVYPPSEAQKRHLDDLISVWMRTFVKVPDPTLRRAVDLHISKAVFFPKPAEILALLSAADAQVSEEERQANAAEILKDEWGIHNRIRTLYARMRTLEDAYWHNGKFDYEEWEMLIADMERADCPSLAGGARQRAEQFQSETESSPIEMAEPA